VVGGDPGLTGAPGLAAVVRRLHASQEAEYLQKA